MSEHDSASSASDTNVAAVGEQLAAMQLRQNIDKMAAAVGISKDTQPDVDAEVDSDDEFSGMF